MEAIWKQTARYLAACLLGKQPDASLHRLALASGLAVRPALYKREPIHTALKEATGGTAKRLPQAEVRRNAERLLQAADTCQTAEEMLQSTADLKTVAIGDSRADRCISLWDSWRMLTAIARASGGETEKPSMLLCAFDFSGIQGYIYTISSARREDANTLDILRSRSTSLDILMKEIVRELVEDCGLDDTSVMYSGGGDAYLLLPNTDEMRNKLAQAAEHVNDWLIDHTGTALYLACGMAACAPGDFSDPDAYRDLFRALTQEIAHSKLHRYTTAQLLRLNRPHGNYRECTICHRPAADGKTRCTSCQELLQFSKKLTGQPVSISVQTEKPTSGVYLTIPSIRGGDRYVVPDEKGARSYGGLFAAKQRTLSSLAAASTGISRIGVLRADVDNLGQTFISGFSELAQTGGVNLLLMTSILSRTLTKYFTTRFSKLFVNPNQESMFLPGDPKQQEKQAAGRPRHVTAIYAGGDDVFLVGAWDDLLASAYDMATDFHTYMGEKLSISAGIGMYQPNYPVFGFANETGEMESAAKEIADGDKNAVALFEAENVFHWSAFDAQIIDKMKILDSYFRYTLAGDNEGGGTSFLFNIKTLIDELLEKPDKRIDLARFAYLLARMKPSPSDPKGKKDAYPLFQEKLYDWMRDSEQRRRLQTAINLYLYLKRSKEGNR